MRIEQPALRATPGVRAIAGVGVALQLAFDEQRFLVLIPVSVS
jgi:hypothetical protein